METEMIADFLLRLFCKKPIIDPPFVPRTIDYDYFHDQIKLMEQARFRSNYARPWVGCVYLLADDAGRYKIGLSVRIKNRLHSIQTAHPSPIRIIHIIATDRTDILEQALHRLFSDKRLHGEWFALSEQDVRSICRIRGFVFHHKMIDIRLLDKGPLLQSVAERSERRR